MQHASHRGGTRIERVGDELQLAHGLHFAGKLDDAQRPPASSRPCMKREHDRNSLRQKKTRVAPGAGEGLEGRRISVWNLELELALQCVGFPREHRVVLERGQDDVAQRKEEHLQRNTLKTKYVASFVLATWTRA